jgi:hypothetical protein
MTRSASSPPAACPCRSMFALQIAHQETSSNPGAVADTSTTAVREGDAAAHLLHVLDRKLKAEQPQPGRAPARNRQTLGWSENRGLVRHCGPAAQAAVAAR